MKKKLMIRTTALVLAFLLAFAGMATAASAATVLTQVDMHVTAPSGGMTSETAPEVTVSDKAGYSVEWTGWSTEEGYEPEGTITFEEGQTYYFLVKLKADEKYDFYYNTQAEVEFTGEGSVVETTSMVNNDQTGYSSITYLIAVKAREPRFKGMISDIILDVNAPMEGQTSSAAPKVTTPENKGYAISAAVWCDSDGRDLTEPVRFVGGETYYFRAELTADDGCWWNQLGALQTNVNGAELQDVLQTHNSDWGCWADVLVAVTAGKAPENVVPYVDLGFNVPASGTEITFNPDSYYIEATPEAESFLSIPEDADYAYSSYWSALWADSTGDSVSDNFTLYGGAPGYIIVLLKATNGKRFDMRYTSVSVENAEILEASLDGGLLFICFSFVPEKGENYVSLSFDPNGGEGEMPTLSMPAGKSYTLPECGFTKEERNFTAWEVNGEKKKPKDVITVDADTVVKALWYKTKSETIDNTVDASTAEVIGSIVLTDSDTGEETTVEVSRGTCSSLFTNPTGGEASALVEETEAKIRAKAEALGIAVGDDSIQTNIKVVDTVDKRTFKLVPDMMDEDGDLYYAFVLDGEFSHVWEITLTLTAEIPGFAGLLGDADNNGRIESIDVTWIQRSASQVEIPFDIDSRRADIDGSGALEIIDATYIQRYLAGLKTDYPIGQPIS